MRKSTQRYMGDSKVASYPSPGPKTLSVGILKTAAMPGHAELMNEALTSVGHERNSVKTGGLPGLIRCLVEAVNNYSSKAGRMRIVLVDPSRAIQRAMTDLIVPGEHEVFACSQGQKALERIAADDQVGTLITSVQLADMSGIQLCAAARKLAGSRRSLFIIVMSSTDDYEQVIQAFDNGADDFIRKPPPPEELRARLRAASRFTSIQRDLIRYATSDSLTGFLNRRAFFADAAEACTAAASGNPLSVILFDVDRFKRINDMHGHQAGDVVLAKLGAAVRRVSEGPVGRLGGEEFCLLLSCDLAEAVEVAEDLRQSIKALDFTEMESFGVTCSFGVAEWENGDTIDRILRRADLAMYEAKHTGRDRVIAADSFVVTDRHEKWRGVARATTVRKQ
jgi:two-component system, cell cycle response regulator